MIAKATQLKNAESLGFSDTSHISYWNYWLLLLFIVGVQIALSSKYGLIFELQISRQMIYRWNFVQKSKYKNISYFTISSRWLTEEFALVVVLNDGQPRLACKYGNDEFLLSQAYVIILLLLALCLNSTNKNIKRNHKVNIWIIFFKCQLMINFFL